MTVSASRDAEGCTVTRASCPDQTPGARFWFSVNLLEPGNKSRNLVLPPIFLTQPAYVGTLRDLGVSSHNTYNLVKTPKQRVFLSGLSWWI